MALKLDQGTLIVFIQITKLKPSIIAPTGQADRSDQSIYSLRPMSSAILSLKKSHKECNSRDWISITCLIKWLDLNFMPKLTICGKQMRV